MIRPAPIVPVYANVSVAVRAAGLEPYFGETAPYVEYRRAEPTRWRIYQGDWD